MLLLGIKVKCSLHSLRFVRLSLYTITPLVVYYNTTMTASLALLRSYGHILYSRWKVSVRREWLWTVCKSAKSFPSFLKLMINRWWWVRYTTQGVKLGIDLTMSIKREVVVVETRDTHKYEASAALCTYIQSNTMQHLMTVFTWSLTQFSYSDVELNQSYTQQMPYHQEVFNRMHLYKSSVVSCLNLTIKFPLTSVL